MAIGSNLTTLSKATLNKRCSKCMEYKDLSEFGKRSLSNDGLQYMCKSCHKAAVKRNYKEKREQRIEYARQHYELVKEARKYYNAEYHRDHAIEHSARNILNYNLRMGRITKPENCEKCGKPLPLEAHHEDYSKPLEINWLCRTCHSVIHKGT